MCHLQEDDLEAIRHCATSADTPTEHRAISHARAVVLRSQTRSTSVFHVMAMPVFSLMAPSVIRHYRRWSREQWLTW